jgi:SNF2 family DNA or RNA helicase
VKWIPHGYMKRAISFCISQACAGLLLAPGMGKTSIMLAVFKLLRAKGYVRRMLVITPLRPMERVWPAEAAKWDEFQGLKVSLLHGPDKDMKLRRADSDIDVINPEGLAWLATQVNPRGELPWDVLCVDESTRFKNDRTQRFKLLRPYLEHFKRRYILTGSPAPNGLLDLFGQVYIMDLGNALGRYVSHYRTEYFRQTGYGGYTWVPKSDAETRIYRRLGPLALRLAAEDYLKLPPLLFNRVEVDLPPVARKAYREMESLLVTQVQEEKVLAANAAAATMKCRQIANGGIYGQGPEGRVAHELHEAKVDAVEEIIEELQGKPALVAYEFEHDRRSLTQETWSGNTLDWRWS